MIHISEYEIENLFLNRLESIGYEYVEMKNYEDVLSNLHVQLAAFNAEKLIKKKGETSLSDTEFERLMIHPDNHTVYESAKLSHVIRCIWTRI